MGFDREEAEPTGAQRTESRLSLVDHSTSESKLAVVRMHGQPVKTGAPSIPSGNEGSNDFVAIGGQDDRLGIMAPQRIEAFDVVRRGCDFGCRPPERKNEWELRR